VLKNSALSGVLYDASLAVHVFKDDSFLLSLPPIGSAELSQGIKGRPQSKSILQLKMSQVVKQLLETQTASRGNLIIWSLSRNQSV